MNRPADRAGPALLRGSLRRRLLDSAEPLPPTAQLARLAQLHARRLISDQEYDRARRRLEGGGDPPRNPAPGAFTPDG